jgi:MFS family permease
MPPRDHDRDTRPTKSEDDGAVRRLRDLETREADVEAPPGQVVRHGGTFESFKHRDFTLFWSGAFVSNVGTWMQNVVLSLVVYSFRRSETDLGLVSFAQGIPVLFLAIWAGSLADRLDRKRLIIATQVVLMVQAAMLGWLYMTGQLSSAAPVSALVWVVGLSLLLGVMSALSFPAWQSVIPDLVPRRSLLNAIALNSAQFQSARMLGPLVASALLLVGLRADGIFYVNAASFVFVIAALWVVRLRPSDRAHPHGVEESGWTRLTAGIRYARENRTVGTIVLSTAILTLFGMGYVVLIPAVADKVLGFHEVVARDRVASYIYAANGFGAVISALLVASLPPSVRRENLMRYSLLAMALLLLAFSASRTLPLILIASACAGAALLTTNALANTSIQATVPNHLRGRVMSLFVMSFMGLMPVAGLLIGPIAEKVGTMTAIAGSATLLLLWALVLLVRPGMLGLDKPAEGPAGVAPLGRWRGPGS